MRNAARDHRRLCHHHDHHQGRHRHQQPRRRVENLAHVLLWSDADGGSGGARLSLIELPRLRLSFDVSRPKGGGPPRVSSPVARRATNGQMAHTACARVPQVSSREHPGLYLGWLECERALALLRGDDCVIVI